MQIEHEKPGLPTYGCEAGEAEIAFPLEPRESEPVTQGNEFKISRPATSNASKTTDIKPTNIYVPPMQPVCLPICRLRLPLMLRALA